MKDDRSATISGTAKAALVGVEWTRTTILAREE
jgi:hypothetical protein